MSVLSTTPPPFIFPFKKSTSILPWPASLIATSIYSGAWRQGNGQGWGGWWGGLERSTASTAPFVERQIRRRGKDLHTQSHTLLTTRGIRDDNVFQFSITNPTVLRKADVEMILSTKQEGTSRKTKPIFCCYKLNAIEHRIQTRGCKSLNGKDVWWLYGKQKAH